MDADPPSSGSLEAAWILALAFSVCAVLAFLCRGSLLARARRRSRASAPILAQPALVDATPPAIRDAEIDAALEVLWWGVLGPALLTGLRLAAALAPERGWSLQLLVVLAVIMIAEVLPSRLAEHRTTFYAERLGPRLAGAVRPLAWLLGVGRGAPAGEPRPAPSRDEELLLDSLIEATDDDEGEPVLDPTAHELLRRLVRLRDTRVRDAMTRRDRVPSLPHGTTLQEAAECLRRTQSTRILVTGKSIDDVLGVLHLKDVFRERLKPPLGGAHAEIDGALAQIARPVAAVSVDDTLGEVLMSWRRDGRSMAVVESDDGRVIGFITYVDISRWLMRGLERPKTLVPEKEQAS